MLPLAMLVPSLAAGETLELTKCNEATAELAIENWHIPVPANQDVSSELVPMLMEWWESNLMFKTDWPASLKSLSQQLGL
jgi:hypothetical protein